jgi:hypothetical protein
MAYNKTNWENSPSTNTPINSNNLNKIEDGIYNNSLKTEQIGSLSNLETTNKTSLVGAINENKENIDNIKGKILWTNSNPSTSFADQDVSLTSDDYDLLEIFFNQGTTNTACWSARAIKGYGTQLIVTTNLNEGFAQTTGTRLRVVNYISDTTLHIGNCLTRDGAGSVTPTVNNTGLIPMYIVGYKTGLFSV